MQELYEPFPRLDPYHGVVLLEGEPALCIWGGENDLISAAERRRELTSKVDLFDSYQGEWKSASICGSPPLGVDSGASASDDHFLYVYGGHDGAAHHGSLHQLDMHTCTWTELSRHTADHGPTRKVGCRMVLYQHKLVLFGGYLNSSGQNTWTNELHTFDLKKGKCSSYLLQLRYQEPYPHCFLYN